MTRDDILAIMRSYNVAKHYRSSSVNTGMRYCVFKIREGAVTDPLEHGEAVRRREEIVADAILELAGGQP